MKRFLVLCCMAPIATVAIAQDDVAKKELARFQGTWSAVSLEWTGKASTKEDVKAMKLIFKDEELTIKSGERILGKGTVKLDPAKMPKEIDYREAKDIYSAYDCGIYAFEGDSLKLCTSADRAKRPTAFDSKQGMVLVLKREKP